MDEPSLTIGEVARRAGLATSAIRHYECAGVLPSAERKPPQVEALIARAEAMRAWLELARECGCPSLDVCALFDEHTTAT